MTLNECRLLIPFGQMATASQESCQWLSVTEEALFLHDGLMRVSDLVALPNDVNNSQDPDSEVISFDLKNPEELSQRLLVVCGTHNNAYAKLLEYRLNALRGLWSAQKQVAADDESEKESSSTEDTIVLLRKQGLLKDPDQVSFATRVSILLVLPLLQSQSLVDPQLCGVTSAVLLNCLRDCAPLSLSKEPGDCFKGLESLLCSWLGEKTDAETQHTVQDKSQRKNIAAALVALACARGHLKTFIHTIHLLLTLTDIDTLQVSDILGKLIDTEGGPGHVPALLGSKHILSWGFEDMLTTTEKDSGEKEKPCEGEVGRSLTCDGVFLFTTNSCGKGLAKVGTGLHGSLRGYIYVKNTDVGPGKVAFGRGHILYRPQAYDVEAENAKFFQIIDKCTLQPIKTIPKHPSLLETGPCTTVALCSDGSLFYWVWCPATANDKSNKAIPVYVDIFEYKIGDSTVVPVQSRITLVKKDTDAKSNDTLMSRLRPIYRGSASALAALVGVDSASSKKDDASAQQGITSCGLALKVLVKTPVFTEGSHLILLTSLPGASAGSAARSPFGSVGALSSIRCALATNHCYSLTDGHLSQRPELVDAPNCSIARGAQIPTLGVCYDVCNNLLWACSADWVDQFNNPAHQAPHHIRARLDIATTSGQPETKAAASSVDMPVSLVIQQLLQHVGSMCLHQLHSDLMYTPFSSYILQQYPIDFTNLARISDILNKSLESGQSQTVICALIILQLLFKMSVIKIDNPEQEELLQKTRKLVWKLVSSKREDSDHMNMGRVQKEACLVLANGLMVLYPKPEQRVDLMRQLLSEGEHQGLFCLRDKLLVDYTEQLKGHITSLDQYQTVSLPDDVISLLIKRTLKESISLLQDATKMDKQQFEHMLSEIPVASPGLRFLMSLQSFLLREAVLYVSPDTKTGSDTDIQPMKELWKMLETFAKNVFREACEVLKTLLKCCQTLITDNVFDLETRLQGLEKVAKVTILGHMVPPLMTALTHMNLQSLTLADTLMPTLVELVVFSSQAALLLKSHVQIIHQEDMETDSDSEANDSIGQTAEPESQREEEGFLSGLKIPAPWSSGKSIESIHPVRDNYKFKETVHIPGARCLYLRFDNRCASQYDYDKMILYAGANTTSKKVAEYGGNTYGFGSRSVLGSGWPKDLVRVEGDTVTFSFEMRSGREHNTPDKALWGFLVTIRAQETPEEISTGLPFLADLALGLSVLACTMLQLMYQGPEKTREEEACQHLLKSKLLQRCVWQSGTVSTAPGSPKPSPRVSQAVDPCLSPMSPRIPRIKLPSEIMKNLLSLAQRHPPHLRPSMSDAIKPDVILERIVSAVVKHLGLEETVRFFTPSKENHTDEFQLLTSLMEEICRRTDALVRQLQALADLEQRWHTELIDRREDKTLNTPPFFHDYHLQETQFKALFMLCFLKDVSMDSSKLEDAATELREKLDGEISSSNANSDSDPLQKTRQLVDGILSRLDLLLHVNISPGDAGTLTRTVSQCLEAIKSGSQVMVRSDTDIIHATVSRSMSAPSGVDCFHDDTILDLAKKHRRRPKQKPDPMTILQDLVDDQEVGLSPHAILIGQLFQFIGSAPEKAVSCEAFLQTAKLRWLRGNTRKQALVHMRELLSAASRVGGATHLVAAVTSVLRHGPRVEELTCGGMVSQVREAFAETMTSVVQVVARYPIACCNSIGLLCIVPYTRAEEKCLVRSGLVHLLDKLCSLASNQSDSRENQSVRQKVSAMAWAGFQVLANRCVMWETEEGAYEDLEHSGLARQVSVLLTNHLARATESSGNEAAGTEALQEVLSLLNNLSRSHMGKAILSQPACVSKLLSLLLDQRPSPKLVLIILQLCRVALPLMDAIECERVELPTWGHMPLSSHWSTSKPISDPAAKIVSLLLARLGDFLVPGLWIAMIFGDLATVASRQQSIDPDHSRDKGSSDDFISHNGRASVFVHKREDQQANEVVSLCLGTDSRQFRLGGASNVEKASRLEKELTKNNKAEVVTEDVKAARKKAEKWAQIGLTVSIGPPTESAGDSLNGDKKKTEKEVICKDKNAELARLDLVRPFISGHVANSMAAEVIELLHSLLNTPDYNTDTNRSWSNAVQRVLMNALAGLPVLLNSLDSLSSPRCHTLNLMYMARQVNAALCALGGFQEMIKPGCHVEVLGNVEQSTGIVVNMSQQTGLVTVKLDSDLDGSYSPRYAENIQVPFSRVKPVRNRMFASERFCLTDSVVTAMQAILLPREDNISALQQVLPLNDDGNSMANQICRVVAELETRACSVLALYLQNICFTKEFIQHCGSTIEMLKCLAKDCSTGARQPVVESHCERLRTLYRDCAKPPPPPSKVDNRNKEMTWDACRVFPPVQGCLFSNNMSSLTFLGDPSARGGFPRGTMVYANMPIPQQAPSFYWELEFCSFGDGQEESAVFVSFGFAPLAEKKDGPWTNPLGTCLFLSNGKAVHYNGASLLQWRSVRLDCAVKTGGVAGIGWERSGDAPPPGETPRGRVYFTYNGRRLQPWIDDVAGAMFPVVHIQKKAAKVKANFGTHAFAFAEGQQHREAADEVDDMTREIRESFSHLPFSQVDSDSEEAVTAPTTPSNVSDMSDLLPPSAPACKTIPIPKPLKDYNPDNCKLYKLFNSYDSMLSTGPEAQTVLVSQDSLSDEESVEEEQNQEDHYVLLVKAWEQKVFPVIRRRFRNEAERKDGLEQIKGALQLGMTDIARQTVEFLYEENGGMPRDLHLPTIEDIKEDLAKFTIERVKKGTTVVIKDPTGSNTSGATVLPKFAVRSMLKTFGLTGTVLDVDTPLELVQVETYLRSEGVLVRYWYPLNTLERPPQGLRKSAITGGQILDTSNVNIHRELMRTERTLARMYCRRALLKLIDHCNSSAMEVISCSPSLTSGMAASAAVLQELDIENIQLLSNELLRAPQPHGAVTARSLGLCDSSQHCLAAQSCSLSNLVYYNVQRLKHELATAIARAAGQGEDYLIELTNQICTSLQTAPEMFLYEEIPVSENKTTTDLYFPGAACLVVSCKTDPKYSKKETSLYKSPWARIFCYSGQRIKKNGQISKQEVVSYPRDITSTSNQDDQYTPAIIPTDCIHVKVGVSPPPGIVITIHALPPQFLLAMTYIETLITETYGCGTKSCVPPKQEEPCSLWDMPSSPQSQTQTTPTKMAKSMEKEPNESLWNLDNIVITPPVFSHMIEQICFYLWRTDVPALIKEYVFHQLAQSVRVYHYSEGGNSCKLPSPLPHLNVNQGLMVMLHSELKILYETETKGLDVITTPSGSGFGIGVSDQGRFSTYFHALLELNLAVGELSKPTGRSRGSDTAISLDVLPHPPISPTHASRKKLRAKRDRKRDEPGRRSESDLDLSQPASTVSPSVSDTNAGSSSAASVSGSSSSVTVEVSAGKDVTGKDAKERDSRDAKHASKLVKPESELWLQRALSMSHILRCLAFNEKNGMVALVNAVSDANQVLNTVTAHQRLMIITGIPTGLDPESIKQALRTVFKSNGGIERDEIFLPVDDISLSVEPEPAKSPLLKDEATGETPSKVSSENSEHTSKSPEEHVKQSGLEVPGKKEEPTHDGETDETSVLTNQTKHCGYAVVSLMSKTKVEIIKKSLVKIDTFFVGAGADVVDISISGVGPNLLAQDENANVPLDKYLKYKFFQDKTQNEIGEAATLALTEIYTSCFIVEQRHGSPEFQQESGFICLSQEQILQQTPENLLSTFFNNIRPPKISTSEQVSLVLKQYGMLLTPDKEWSPALERSGKGKGKKPQRSSKEKLVLQVEKSFPKDKKDKSEKDEPEDSENPTKCDVGVKTEERHCLTLDGFLQYVADLMKQDPRSVWRAVLSCGFDIHLERCACLDNGQAQQFARQWTLDMDATLTQFVNSFCRKLCVTPARLHPHEIYVSEADLAGETYAALQDVPIESIRLRFAFLQSLNNSLETFFLPLIDLRPWETYSRSMAAVMSKVRGLIFYDTKSSLVNRILNATTKRKPDQAAPEITLDPLEDIGGQKSCMNTGFCQAYRQMSQIPSSQLCVRLACGGDPTYAFNVKFTGEEVHGTSGSFRHFLWKMAREIQDPSVSLLVPCSSTSYRGRCILRPGPLTVSEENLITFLGQLLGITIRADIPIGLDLMASFWKALVGLPMDSVMDIKEADPLTYSYLKKIEMVESESELLALCADVYPRFVYPSLSGEEVELVPRGRHLLVSWENRQHYINTIQELRKADLMNVRRMEALRTGLATILPLQLLVIMTPGDMEMRTCGQPVINIAFLKAHTMYQVGLMETDKHIQYFWHTLENLSQEDLCRFIKFACNQERIPQACPCKDGGTDTAHVPPYPMKIAPPDGTAGSPDSRYIRVETCMFMIKLPQYSSQEVMTQRLLYAIHCREDPLSG
ncbi:probable E3 ubiquitin-protein ligase HECTD4 isoform X2 [Dreissena polymorpha]|uniref:probable E3 ubiquitin-protein ligase HECTD4 isoform X2 n=1 Tax=Dreissena polymorpha TaxID=45954 RepID=UPI0022643871|nr:probable E3 ubiquitin-protein ligase HECTD4 isoform X2 [Dreissena polymorpha]